MNKQSIRLFVTSAIAFVMGIAAASVALSTADAQTTQQWRAVGFVIDKGGDHIVLRESKNGTLSECIYDRATRTCQ